MPKEKTEIIQIKVLLWDENSLFDFGQCSKKRKHYLQLPHTFLQGDLFRGLTNGEKNLVINLLGQCSIYNRNILGMSRNILGRYLKSNRKGLENVLDRLERLQVIEIIESPKTNNINNINKINKERGKNIATIEAPRKKTPKAGKPLLAFKDSDVDKLLSIMTEKTLAKWKDRYDNDEWVKEAVTRALRYHNDNHYQGRTQDGWNRYLSNNLQKQVEWYPPKKKVDMQKLFQEVAEENGW